MTITAEQLDEWRALARMLRQRVQFLIATMPPRNRGEVPSLTAAAEAIDQSIAEVERLREAIKAIAEHLKDGDDNGAYLIARAALPEETAQ